MRFLIYSPARLPSISRSRQSGEISLPPNLGSSPGSALRFSLSLQTLSALSKPRFFPRAEMSLLSQDVHPTLADNRVVLGCGALSVDYLATVEAFPKPDDKIRSTSLKVEGGGNAGNALTCAARLGLKPRLISKIANDVLGSNILTELEGDGVDTSFIVASEGNSPFTYIIVDNETIALGNYVINHHESRENGGSRFGTLVSTSLIRAVAFANAVRMARPQTALRLNSATEFGGSSAPNGVFMKHNEKIKRELIK